MRSIIFDRLSFLSLFLVVILLPFFFLPFTNIPVEISKGVLLVVGLVCSLVFWCFARLFDGRIFFPKSWLLVSGLGVVVAFLLSALVNASSQVSLFGVMFDIGSFWFIFSGFLLMFMSAVVLGNPKNARLVLFGSIFSGLFVLFFQIVHLIAPKISSLGVLLSKTDNLVGTWNALGIFAGLFALVLLLIVDFYPISRINKWFFQLLILFSMFMVAIVNLSFVWEILGIFALIVFVYKISISLNAKEEESVADRKKNHFPIFSFFIIIISLFFFMSSSSVKNYLPEYFGVQNTEISPSFGSTISVTKSVLRESPVLGLGPNRFSQAWASYKPESVNLTNFWGVSFSSGSGLVPTLASTTGSLGILSIIIFFILFITTSARSIFSGIKNGTNYEMMSFFCLSLYLFISSFFYSTGSVLFFLALAFAGVFAGLSANNKKDGEVSLSFLNDHRKSFFSMLFIVLLIIVSVAVTFKYLERFASFSYFRSAVSAPEIKEAEVFIDKALRLQQNDLYLRTRAQIYLLKLDSLVRKGESLTDAEKANLQPVLDQAVRSGELATVYNPKNYLNFETLGSLYQSLASFGVKDATGKAIEAYKTASTLNPSNPRLKILIANLYFDSKDIGLAKENAESALLLKSNYVDALILLSQIAKNEDEDALVLSYAQKALSYAQEQLSTNPQNADLIEQTKNLAKYVDSLKVPVITPNPSTQKKP